MSLDRKTPRRGIILLLVFAGLAWTALRPVLGKVPPAPGSDSPVPLGTPSVPVPKTGPSTGLVAPDFTLETLDGEKIRLWDLRGQVVLINFWATWCPPCREEMPAIQSVYDRYRDEGFVVLAVNLLETNAEVTEFTDGLGLSFPIPMDRNAEVFFLYEVRGLPTSFFLDQAGVIRNMKIGGPMSEGFIEDQVTDLLTSEVRVPDDVP